MNEFSERYKKLTNDQLFIIVRNAGDYQTEAVEAANFELNSRNLTESDVDTANNLIYESEKKVIEEKEKQERHRSNVNNRILQLKEKYSPFEGGLDKSERIIRMCILSFVFFTLYSLYSDYELFTFLFVDQVNRSWDLSVYIFLISNLLLVLGTFYFVKRKRLGWVFWIIILVNSVFSTFGMAYSAYVYQPSGFELLDMLVP